MRFFRRIFNLLIVVPKFLLDCVAGNLLPQAGPFSCSRFFLFAICLHFSMCSVLAIRSLDIISTVSMLTVLVRPFLLPLLTRLRNLALDCLFFVMVLKLCVTVCRLTDLLTRLRSLALICLFFEMVLKLFVTVCRLADGEFRLHSFTGSSSLFFPLFKHNVCAILLKILGLGDSLSCWTG